MNPIAHTTVGRRGILAVALVVLGLLAFGVSRADATVTTYFNNYSCCANREFSAYYVYQLSNAAATTNSQVVCVQEQVFPNYPSGSGAFFDGYKCGSGSTSHSLNGQNVDRALCWVNGSSVFLSCAEGY